MRKDEAKIWGSRNPHKTPEVSQDSEKVTIWCALATSPVICPFSFDEPTITGKSPIFY